MRFPTNLIDGAAIFYNSFDSLRSSEFIAADSQITQMGFELAAISIVYGAMTSKKNNSAQSANLR